MTHREKVIKRLEKLRDDCPTQGQKEKVQKSIDIAKTCTEEEIAKMAE
jgi:hypothetical protein